MSPGLRGTSAEGSGVGYGGADGDGLEAAVHCATSYRSVACNVVAGEVGAVTQGVAFESARDANELGRGHAFGERIGTGTKHLPLDGDARRVGFIARADANGVEGLQRDVTIADEDVGKVEGDGFGVQVGRGEANDFAQRGGLGEQIAIAVEQVAQVHAIAIRDAAGAGDMAFEIDGAVAVGENGVDVNAIAVFQREGVQAALIGGRVGGRRG